MEWWCGREIDNDVFVDIESKQNRSEHKSPRRRFKKVAARRALDVQLDGVRKMLLEAGINLQTPPSRHNRSSTMSEPPSDVHSNGHVNNLVQERHVRNLDGFRHCLDPNT